MQGVERHIRAWLASFVVGLDLCPFAGPLLDAANLRISISDAGTPEELRLAFLRELDLFQNSTEQEIATTLLAFPCALASFDDYLDFLEEAQALLSAAGLEELVQLASFHPRYQFDGADPDAWADAFPAALRASRGLAPVVLGQGDTLPAPTLDYLTGGGTPLVCGTTTTIAACGAAEAALNE